MRRSYLVIVVVLATACSQDVTSPRDSSLRSFRVPSVHGNLVLGSTTLLGGTDAESVNDAGQAIGIGGSSLGTRPLLWYNGTTVDLGTLGGNQGYAFDINSNGVSVGTSQTSSGTFHSTKWDGGNVFDLGVLPGGSYSDARGINDAGSVVGLSTNASGAQRAFLYANGSMQELGNLGGPWSIANDVNEAGEVVGTSTLPAGYPRAVIWKDGNTMNLGTLGGLASEAFGINNAGQAVGWSTTAAGEWHAFVWKQGVMTDLGTLGGTMSQARGINDNGVIVGISLTAAGVQHATAWDAGTITDLGTIGGAVSWAYKINGHNQVVGSSQDATSHSVGVLWTLTQPNFAPVVTRVTLPAAPIPLGTVASATALFTDSNVGDTHSAIFNWETGENSASSIVEPTPSTPGTASGSFTYSAAGVYTVVATASDGSLTGSHSSSVDEPAYIVVYDPSAGFVTGGGWINSPSDACNAAAASDPSVCATSSAGRATFGFVSKYAKGATRPSGSTEFQFSTGKFSFASTSYDWMVIAGARAQYKGSGSVNGRAGYDFMLTAIDGDINKAGPDQFRIKVIERLSGAVVYDNKRGASDDENLLTQIGGGSIVIHK